jgi:predicted SPOUT superfamily RNA methylase MTH1
MTKLWPRISVDIGMKKIVSLQKLAETKKDARLTIRIPKELKIRIDGIDQIYGVALPKIANECLKAFCEYVEQKKQTPTFPLSIGSSLPSDKTPSHISIRRRRGFHDGHRQRR